MNKTVLDAVNEFKGEFPYKGEDASIIYSVYSLSGFSDYYGTGNSTPNSNWYKVCSYEEFNECVKECSDNFGKPTKSIYTKAMSDNGEPPLVGMECMINGHKRVILLTADNDGDYVTMNNGGIYDSDGIHNIKPIDNRTDKEKAIDDLFKLDESICNNTKWHENFLDEIIAGNIHGVTWSGK